MVKSGRATAVAEDDFTVEKTVAGLLDMVWRNQQKAKNGAGGKLVPDVAKAGGDFCLEELAPGV